MSPFVLRGGRWWCRVLTSERLASWFIPNPVNFTQSFPRGFGLSSAELILQSRVQKCSGHKNWVKLRMQGVADETETYFQVFFHRSRHVDEQI